MQHIDDEGKIIKKTTLVKSGKLINLLGCNYAQEFLNSIICVLNDYQYFENICYSSSGNISTGTYTSTIILKNAFEAVFVNEFKVAM